ncbi:hypothetical protein ABNF97_15785 [Plantactinospora sp. B6F1]|uniref:hypothetical protein n=1 Tax=Plantactinospora sp. B6F1 TaxID=3158971 RepID=UPI00102ABE53
MHSEYGFDGLRQQAELIGWRLDIDGVTGTGTDRTGAVRAHLNDEGRVSHMEVDRSWWRDLGPDRLEAAILEATTQAANDRVAAWSARVAERADAEASPDRPLTDRRQTDVRPWGGETERPTEGSDRGEELIRMLELLRVAASELDDYRHRAAEAVRQPVSGRREGDRVAVWLTGGQVTAVEISRRWLHQQPTGRAIADEVELACFESYRQLDLQTGSTFAALPAVAEVRELAANPAALLRRLGLGS